jgi:signal transduction histidine kinase
MKNTHDLVILVSDSGYGISEDEMDKAWDELFRGKSVRRLPGSE